jgi:predicted O-methyltransferase YrrM
MTERTITPTKESLLILKGINRELGKSFHHHNHVLLDIANQFYKKEDQITYLEIGTYKGASSLLMCHRENTKVVTVDRGKPIPMDLVRDNFNKYNPRPENSPTQIIGDSHSSQTFKIVEEETNGEVDILFIDGDHSEKGVIKDFELYSPLIKKGGFIVFDDYEDAKHSPEVKPTVNNLMAKHYDDWEIMFLPANILDAKPKQLQHYNVLVARKK